MTDSTGSAYAAKRPLSALDPNIAAVLKKRRDAHEETILHTFVIGPLKHKSPTNKPFSIHSNAPFKE